MYLLGHGEGECESKSYEADQHCVQAVGRATGISKACDSFAIHAPKGVGPGVVM